MSDDYDVGYGKPPKHTRFTKGRSGNPSGRPRGSRNVLEEIRDELSGFIVSKDGRKIRKGRALIKALFAQALKGDVRAARLLLEKLPEISAMAIAERENKHEQSARMMRNVLLETFGLQDK